MVVCLWLCLLLTTSIPFTQGVSAMLLSSQEKIFGSAVAYFVFNRAIRKRLKIWLTPEAERILDGHTEKNVPARNLDLCDLTQGLPDALIKERGGNQKVAVTLAHICALIEADKLSKGGWFVAYIAVGDVLWTLRFLFRPGSQGWHFLVFPAEDVNPWHIADQFFIGELS